MPDGLQKLPSIRMLIIFTSCYVLGVITVRAAIGAEASVSAAISLSGILLILLIWGADSRHQGLSLVKTVDTRLAIATALICNLALAISGFSIETLPNQVIVIWGGISVVAIVLAWAGVLASIWPAEGAVVVSYSILLGSVLIFANLVQ